MTNQNIIANCSINIGLLNARAMITRNGDINKPIAIHELITDRQYVFLLLLKLQVMKHPLLN